MISGIRRWKAYALVPRHKRFRKALEHVAQDRQGIRRFNITEPFLFSCDDHFFTRDVDLQLVAGSGQEHIYTEEMEKNTAGNPRYQRSVAQNFSGPTSVNTVWHGNMWIDPKYLDDVIGLAKDNESKSVYGFEPMMLFEAFRRNDPNRKD